jgi:hypothetical protein
MRFVLNGVAMDLDAATVSARLQEAQPEPVREHGVRIGGTVYPVMQAFELAARLPRTQFTSHIALRHLRNLGFETVSRSSPAVTQPAQRVAPNSEVADGWPWEGSVQATFGRMLYQHGWSITSMADTAAKATGVDVLATKGSRRLGAEVKGWPSTTYADPRRADEVKPTQPSTQAHHWFTQALGKAMMLLDDNPGLESLMVLPDYPRYRTLAARTRTGRRAAGIHVVLLTSEGGFTSETWTP